MMTFGWPTRLKYGMWSGLGGWLAGCVVTLPFEVGVAWRYVDGHAGQLPVSLAKGLVVWGVFTFAMAMTGFVPLFMPLFVFISPAWIVRRRRILVPGTGLGAMAAMYARMGLLNAYHLRHFPELEAFFWTAPNFFIVSFSLAVVWIYVVLAQRHLVS